MNIEFTPEELVEAQKTNQEIDQIADLIKTNERTVSSSWVRLGSLALRVQKRKYWASYGHHSFGSFVASLEPKVDRKRSQIYLCVGVVETLGGQIEDNKLQDMGITKAHKLAQFARESGKLVPQELIDCALDEKNNIDEVAAKVADALHKAPEEKGKWYDFGGFFVTEEEKLTIESAIEAAKNLDPVIPHDIPEHAARKEVMLRFAMEFMSTYGGS